MGCIRDRAFGAKRRKPTSKPVKKLDEFMKVKIPRGFKIVIDTREQMPLFTDDEYKDIVTRGTVKHGDYTFVGGESVIGIERKRKSDFYMYIIDHDKTTRKLRAMDGLRFKALVIEHDEDDIHDTKDGYSESMTREHVRGFLRSVNLKYNMHVYMHGKREYVERWVLDRLVGMYNIIKDEEKRRAKTSEDGQ